MKKPCYSSHPPAPPQLSPCDGVVSSLCPLERPPCDRPPCDRPPCDRADRPPPLYLDRGPRVALYHTVGINLRPDRPGRGKVLLGIRIPIVLKRYTTINVDLGCKVKRTDTQSPNFGHWLQQMKPQLLISMKGVIPTGWYLVPPALCSEYNLSQRCIERLTINNT